MPEEETSPEPLPLALRVGAQVLELVPDRRYTIGREAGVDMRLQHGSIAKRHAEVALGKASLQVRDIGSETGTWVGDARIEATTVPLGTEFRVGDISIRFEQLVPSGAIAAEHGVLGRFREPTFNELMADQLRRAPWFAISIVAHALLLFLLHWFLSLEGDPPRPEAVFSMSATEETISVEDDEAAEEPIEVEEESNDAIVAEVDTTTNFEAPNEAAESFDVTDAGTNWLGDQLFVKLGSGGKGGGDDVLKEIAASGAAGEFKRTVGDIRRKGLDIAFVFDSTQSMHDVLDETKNRIALMVDVLHALVPSSRVAVVTYRDHGKREEYVTRNVPLSGDYYRSINFMQTVEANGGGDFPEAVFDAISLSSKLNWRKDSRRVVVLIGDAPAHEETHKKLRNMVRSFARDKRSSIHTIMTSSDREGIDPECRESFSMIADAGAGACIPLSDEEQILREVLSLAFGRQFRRSIDEVYQIVEKRSKRISASARDMVKRADLKAIEAALTRKEVDDSLIKALAKSRDPRVAHLLLRVLRNGGTPKSSRHAVSYALQQMLDLTAPPIDPVSARVLDKTYAKNLASRIEYRLN